MGANTSKPAVPAGVNGRTTNAGANGKAPTMINKLGLRGIFESGGNARPANARPANVAALPAPAPPAPARGGQCHETDFLFQFFGETTPSGPDTSIFEF